MRLLDLRLPKFHRDKSLAIEFDYQRRDDPMLAFLVGPNGSGKSRVLEALGHIFAHLSARIPPGLRFELEYELAENRVLVTTESDRVEALGSPPALPEIEGWLLVAPRESEDWQREHVRHVWPTYDEILPSCVIGLSSGPASRLEWALRESVSASLSQRLDESPESAGEAVAPEAWQEHLKGEGEMVRLQLRELAMNPRCISISGQELVLPILALLSHPSANGPGDKVRDEVLDKTELIAGEGLRAFNFDVPADWQTLLPPQQHELFGEFLEAAARSVPLPTASAPALPEEEAPEGDRRIVFVMDEELEGWVARCAATPFIWFSHLTNWLKAGVLRSPQLLFTSAAQPGLLRDRDLSDGEFLLAGRYSLLLLLREKTDCLVLFDEPETHFNDRWKIDLVFDLTRMLKGGRAQLLLATHSDLTLTDADWSDVFLLGDDALLDRGEQIAQTPPISPLGADRAEITQRIFGAESASGRRALEIVQDALSGEEGELEEALRRVGPGFQEFRLQYEREKREDGPARG